VNRSSRSRTPQAAVALLAALSAICVSLCLGATSANATVVYFCGVSGVPKYYWCPLDYPGNDSPRHTYQSNRGYWGTVVHSGCDVKVDIIEFRDSGSSKYLVPDQCNEAFIYHPNNTELLHPQVDSNATSATLTGVAAY
jgi:hypothetical protein